MEIKRFDINTDLKKLEEFLSNQYKENHNMTSWLPERLNDLVYRMEAQYLAKPNGVSSRNYIYLWIDNEKIVASILPDGDAIYMSIKNGYENIFKEMVLFAEINCKPLFKIEEDGYINFLIVSHDSLEYKTKVLEELGYVRDSEGDFDNYIYPRDFNREIKLPDGYKLVYGEEVSDELAKWSACDIGFHPEYENDHNYHQTLDAYDARKNATMYKDSFECLVMHGEDICSYSFCYVNKDLKTAFIEPVSTREKYRHMGIGSAMMAGIIYRCKDSGIEKVYVNSFGWRKNFYNAAGFTTEDSQGFWYKRIK